MATIPAGAREFLATGPLAHVVTLDPDGTPQVTLAWAGFDGDQVLLSSFFDQHKLDNLRRDPRITLSFEAHESGGERLHPYLVVSGQAQVTPGGALDVMDKLAAYYIGPGRRYGWREGPPGFTIRVDVDRIYGVGSWRGSDDAEDEG
jgi:PPOX class probable F420-dependent enzyme